MRTWEPTWSPRNAAAVGVATISSGPGLIGRPSRGDGDPILSGVLAVLAGDQLHLGQEDGIQSTARSEGGGVERVETPDPVHMGQPGDLADEARMHSPPSRSAPPEGRMDWSGPGRSGRRTGCDEHRRWTPWPGRPPGRPEGRYPGSPATGAARWHGSGTSQQLARRPHDIRTWSTSPPVPPHGQCGGCSAVRQGGQHPEHLRASTPATKSLIRSGNSDRRELGPQGEAHRSCSSMVTSEPAPRSVPERHVGAEGSGIPEGLRPAYNSST